jgi:RecA/RadA recombinase
MLPFLKKYRHQMSKLENVSTDFSPPDMWYSTGCYGLNRVLSGSYLKAVPNGRITAFVGPSAAGKSYVICNVIREAQKIGTHVLVIDSENALDPKFMSRAGVDVSEEALTYLKIVTIQDVTKVISEFLALYEKEYGRDNKTAPKLLIVLDSLNNCLTDAENEKFEKGVQTGDQGQSAKNKKHLLRTLVSRLPRNNACFVFTDQVYPQDVMLGDGQWAVTNGVKYAASGIGLLTKLKLKEGTEITGIRMRMEAYKSRFVKPGTKIEVEIPFKTGLSATAGLIDNGKELGIWEADGIVKKDGHGFLVDMEVDGVLKQVKFKRDDLTEALALQILKTNPMAIAIEKEFNEYEASDLFLPEQESTVTDTETGEILTTENLKEQSE